MKKIAEAWKNLIESVQAMLARRKRRKQEKKEDPFIYPHF